jgi:formylglycine-generating enzyme required for sulfatase activity
MVLVEAFHCPFVAHVCKKRMPGPRGACVAFEPRVLCEGTLRKKRFCVDRFEYPNLEGALPAVLVDWNEAKRACAAEDKRLCTVDEWQLACEGEAILPYTTGVLRAKGDCNWDARAETPVIPTRGLGVATELARLDGRVPSGSLARCVSPFGVHDMGGNVAEWVDDPTGSLKRAPFASVVAGGAFGASEGTCRAVDADGAPSQRASTVGFRCCADPEGLPVPGDKRKAKGGFQPLATAPGLP